MLLHIVLEILYRSGTLFVVLDIEPDILIWLSSLSTKELADCTWLMILPTNEPLMRGTSMLKKLDDSEKSKIGQILSPFQTMSSKFGNRQTIARNKVNRYVCLGMYNQ